MLLRILEFSLVEGVTPPPPPLALDLHEGEFKLQPITCVVDEDNQNIMPILIH